MEVCKSFAKVLEQKYEKVETQKVPILGKIAAGRPIEAIEDFSGPALTIPEDILTSGDFFSLEVEGNSMIEEGILPGDYILVKKQETADNGSTVVALIDGEATVKKFYRHNRKVELRPANKEMESIWVRPGKCHIQGIVSGLYRKY